MDQAELTDRIAEVLEGLPGLGSAFLGGSHGRGEADAYSDVDVYVVVAEAADIPDVLARLAQSVGEISPVLYSKVLPNARTVNCITMDWLRFDLTVVSGIELAFLAGGQVKPPVRPPRTLRGPVCRTGARTAVFRGGIPRRRQRVHPRARPLGRGQRAG